MASTDWETDLADVILTLWMEKLDPSVYITLDDVRPEMAKRGYDMPRDQLSDAMGLVAADNSWKIGMTDNGTIKVLPLS